MAKRGHFIVFEGTDGSGLSTQAELLRNWFRSRQLRVDLTKEPSAGPVGALIRLALNHRLVGCEEHASGSGALSRPNLPEDVMALMFAADRLDHYYGEIQPRLEEGTHVICDRYILSSLAYQSLDNKLSTRWLQQINSHAGQPDITIFLDVPVAVSRQRIEQQRWHDDRYEAAETLKAVRANYLALIDELRKKHNKIVVIDGNRPIDQVHADIVQAVLALSDEHTNLHQPHLIGERWVTGDEAD